VSFDYLLATAQRESALDPAAKARTSSATGLFQFIEQTWLGLVKGEGPKLGLDRYAQAIATRPDGSHAVSDPALRQDILRLREDPKVSAVMAGALTQRNRDLLAAEVGREPTAGDLYVAHFLGARGAAYLIRMAQTSPTRPAAEGFPDAAAANRAIFFDRSGRARGAGEVYAALVASHRAVGQGVAARGEAAAASGPAVKDGPAFHGLFQTGARNGAVSDAVARLWRSEPTDRTRVAALGFFPRAEGPRAEGPPRPDGGEAAPAVGPPALVDAPLPPARPVSLAAAPVERPRRGGPLDLSRFMSWRKGS